MLIVMLGGGALNALDVFFVIQNLHVAAPQLGTISAVYGAGAVLGALLLAGLSQRIQPAVVFWLSLAGLGVTFVVYSRLSAFVAALAVMFIAGFPQAGLSIGLGPIIMKVTPREVLGRVSSIFGPAINLMAMISAGIAGLLDSTILRNLDLRVAGMEFRAVDSIFLCSGLLMLLGGLYARHNLKAVHMDTEEPGADSRQIS
jgi:MFS family permease